MCWGCMQAPEPRGSEIERFEGSFGVLGGRGGWVRAESLIKRLKGKPRLSSWVCVTLLSVTAWL